MVKDCIVLMVRFLDVGFLVIIQKRLIEGTNVGSCLQMTEGVLMTHRDRVSECLLHYFDFSLSCIEIEKD